MLNPSFFPSSDSAFKALALSGVSGYQIQGDRVVVTASEIANHRDVGNVSGSLSLELWALHQPYAGGEFHGIPLAGTPIGQLSGQHFLADARHELPFVAPEPGIWYLTLMLREWEGSGFVTRDHVNFPQAYVVDRSQTVVRSVSDNVITVDFAGKDATPESEPGARDEAPRPATTKTSRRPGKVAGKVRQTKGKAVEVDARVAINEAPLADIASIKGLPAKLAEAIVAGRPYASLEALLEVKGIGVKRLEMLQPFIRI